MLTFKLALRNMVAHRQRTVVMFIVGALVSCLLFLFLAFSDGQLENFRSGLMVLTHPPADIVVYGRGAQKARDQGESWERLAKHSIRGYPRLLEDLRAFPFVASAHTPTTQLTLDLLVGGHRQREFFIRGVDPEHGWQVQKHVRMTEGSFFDESEQPQIILHYKTAPTLGARPGDTVTLTGKDLFGQVVVQDAVLRGFFAGEQDLPNLAEYGFVNMAAYELVSGLYPDETMALSVFLERGEDRDAALAALQSWNQQGDHGLELWRYGDLPKPPAGAYAAYDVIRLIVLVTSLLVLAVVMFGIMSVVSANLHDRRREIGTYYCLGSKKGFLVRLYTLEILLVNGIASAAGVGVGVGLRFAVNALEIRTEEPGLQMVFGGSVFSLGLNPASVSWIVGAMLAVTLATALTTLGSRLRVPPVVALRESE